MQEEEGWKVLDDNLYRLIDSWKDSPTARFPPLWRKYPLARLRKKSGDLGLYEVSHPVSFLYTDFNTINGVMLKNGVMK